MWTADRLASLATHGLELALLFITLGIAFGLRRWEAIHLALISTLYLGAYCLPIIGALWPLPLVAILASYGAVLVCVPQARRTVRFGMGLDRSHDRFLDDPVYDYCCHCSRHMGYAANVDIASYRHFVPSGVPAWAILAGIPAYAMLNAAFEELVWRGVVWQACEAAFGSICALALSTLSFGLAHYRGFPSGALGVVLASTYGLMMGIIRLRTKGLLGPFLAHVFADVVIYAMVAAAVIWSA